jgi:hypothetical protein
MDSHGFFYYSIQAMVMLATAKNNIDGHLL